MPFNIVNQSYLIAILLIIVPLVFSKKIYPPLFLFIYIFLAYSETYGVGMFVSSFPYLNIAISSFLTASTIMSFLRLWKERKASATNFRVFIVALVTGILAFWMYASAVFDNPKNFLRFLEVEYFAGPYALIITLAYYREHRAQLLFIIFIFAQVMLSAAIVMFPNGPWRIFDGLRYINMKRGVSYLMNNDVIYGSRAPGQFVNTIMVGFYGACAMIVSLYLFFAVNTKSKVKIASLAFFIIGLLLQFVSATRTIFMALAFSLILIVTRARGTIKMFILVIIILISLPLFLSWVGSLEVSSQLNPTLYRFKELTNYIDRSGTVVKEERRITVVRRALRHIFDDPLFGCKGDWDKMIKVAHGLPHVAPVSFMLRYGIPAGILLSILLFLGIAPDLIKEQPRFSTKKPFMEDSYFFNRNKRNLCSMFGWLVLLVLMTNEMTPRAMGWIALAISIIPWTESG